MPSMAETAPDQKHPADPSNGASSNCDNTTKAPDGSVRPTSTKSCHTPPANGTNGTTQTPTTLTASNNHQSDATAHNNSVVPSTPTITAHCDKTSAAPKTTEAPPDQCPASNVVSDGHEPEEKQDKPRVEQSTTAAAAIVEGGSGADGRRRWWIGKETGRVLARLEFNGRTYLVTKDSVVVGRESTSQEPDLMIEDNNYVSRGHLVLERRPAADNDRALGGGWYLTCNGKNGVFLNDTLIKKGAEPVEIPLLCTLRFPSTQVRLSFRCCVSSAGGVSSRPVTDGRMSSLTSTVGLTAPNQLLTSPVDSPSNAVNSCSTSPSAATVRRQSVPTFLVTVDGANSETDRFITPSQTSTAAASNTPNSEGTIDDGSLADIDMVDSSGVDAAVVFFEHGRFNANHFQHCRQQSMTRTERLSDSSSTRRPTAAAINNRVEVSRAQNSGAEGSIDGQNGKPPYSYAQLIVQAIASAADQQITLSGIYAYITKIYPWYRNCEKGWQNSIRHNLSLNRSFVRVPRSQEEPGKGSFWRLDPASQSKLIQGAFRKRRARSDKARSAPVSPGLGIIDVVGVDEPIANGFAQFQPVAQNKSSPVFPIAADQSPTAFAPRQIRPSTNLLSAQMVHHESSPFERPTSFLSVNNNRQTSEATTVDATAAIKARTEAQSGTLSSGGASTEKKRPFDFSPVEQELVSQSAPCSPKSFAAGPPREFSRRESHASGGSTSSTQTFRVRTGAKDGRHRLQLVHTAPEFMPVSRADISALQEMSNNRTAHRSASLLQQYRGGSKSLSTTPVRELLALGGPKGVAATVAASLQQRGSFDAAGAGIGPTLARALIDTSPEPKVLKRRAAVDPPPVFGGTNNGMLSAGFCSLTPQQLNAAAVLTSFQNSSAHIHNGPLSTTLNTNGASLLGQQGGGVNGGLIFVTQAMMSQMNPAVIAGEATGGGAPLNSYPLLAPAAVGAFPNTQALMMANSMYGGHLMRGGIATTMSGSSLLLPTLTADGNLESPMVHGAGPPPPKIARKNI